MSSSLLLSTPTFISGWQELKLGAGGYVIGGDVAASDGTMVCKTDVYGAYNRLPGSNRWNQLITTANQSVFGVTPATMIGVWEIKIAPSNTARYVMVFLNKVFGTDNSGSTWYNANLSMTNANANSPTARLFNGKIIIDPANANHVIVGLPGASSPNSGAYETFNFGPSATWAQIASITAPSYGSTAPGIVGMVFDASSGTTTVGGHTVTARALIPSNGNGVYETLDGGATWNLTTSTPVAIGAGQIGPTGSYYISGGLDLQHINVWRYVASTWTEISVSPIPADWFTPAHGTYAGGGAIVADPVNAGYLTVSGPQGGWSGYNTTDADAGSVTWIGTPSNNATVTATDIPYLANAVGGTTFASVGDMIISQYDGYCYFFEGFGTWKFTAQAYGSSVAATSISLGLEELVTGGLLSIPGATQPIWFGFDMGTVTLDLPSYPQAHDPSGGAINHSFSVDYASDTPSFACRIVGNGNSGYSTNYGANGSWTTFTTLPFTSITGAIIACACGPVGSAYATNANMVALKTGIASQTPVVSLDGGATWNPCTGLPSTTWNLGTSRVLIADRNNNYTFYAFLFSSRQLYISTDGGQTFAAQGSAPAFGAGSGGDFTLISVSSNAGHLWGCNGNADLKYSTDSGVTWTAITSVNVNGVGIGSLTTAKVLGVGATKAGASYPTLYFYGTIGSVLGVYRSIDKFSTADFLGNLPTSFPTSCQQGLLNSLTGDMNTYGIVYAGVNSCGGALGVFN